VMAAQLLGDGGVFECRIEDVHRLVFTSHVLAILLVVITAPGWLPEPREGMGFCVAVKYSWKQGSECNFSGNSGGRRQETVL
jgi:hypothetical protein